MFCRDRSPAWAGAVVLGATLTTSSAFAADPTDLATPRGTYVRVDPPNMLTVGDEPLAGGAPHVLYLNRCEGGLTLTQGFEDSSVGNVSSILEGAVTLPAFTHGDASWNEVVSITADMFAPFNIIVTDVDPGQQPHDEAVVCGTSADAGFDGDYWGVAPFGCGVIPTAVTFTFAASIGNSPRDIAETIAQEAAHAWGLDHSFKCEDPMTYLTGCGNKSFQSGDFPCGEFEARACDCGNPTQNTVEHILAAFGPSDGPAAAPTLAIAFPRDGDAFAEGEVFNVELDVTDEQAVANVSLYLDGVAQATDDAAPFGGWPVIDLPAGEYELYAEAVSLSGNVGQSEVITIEIGNQGAGDGNAEGGDDAADDGDGDDGADDGADDGSADDAGDDGPEGDGPPPALPPGWGSQSRGEPAACAVSPEGKHPSAPWLLALIVPALWRRRRRHPISASRRHTSREPSS